VAIRPCPLRNRGCGSLRCAWRDGRRRPSPHNGPAHATTAFQE